jgi:phage FluMu gp28-like protein
VSDASPLIVPQRGVLYPYQAEWLKDDSTFKIGMFARQTGKTFTTTLELVRDCYRAEIKKQRDRWVILSRGERQAREAMREGVDVHIKAYESVLGNLRDTSYTFRDPDSGIERTALEYTWPNGSRVTALPANPDTARGFSANVFLDEFAFHKDSRAIWKALFPVVSNGFKLRITSTPNGKGNMFYDLMTTTKGDWSRHVVDIYRAVADGLPRNVQMLRDNLNDEDAWSQEFELKWLDEATAWLDFDLINSVEHDHAGVAAHYQGGPVFLGEDVSAGKGRDLWVLTVFEQVGDVLWERERLEGNRLSFAARDDLVADVYARYRVIRHCIDQTGMGEAVTESRQRAYGSSRVEGVMFTATSKLNMATIAKQCFQDRKLRIRMGDNALRADLHSLKKENGPTGTPRFVVDDTSGQSGASHADRAWSMFLALTAASGPVVKMEFQAVGNGRASDVALAGFSGDYGSGRADVSGYM